MKQSISKEDSDEEICLEIEKVIKYLRLPKNKMPLDLLFIIKQLEDNVDTIKELSLDVFNFYNKYGELKISTHSLLSFLNIFSLDLKDFP